MDMNSVENPIKPRAGTKKIIRTCPVPVLIISAISALRCPIASMIEPIYSSGVSI